MRSVSLVTICAAIGVAATTQALGRTPASAGPRDAAAGAGRAAGAAVMVMRQVCLPLLQGARLDAIAPPVGFRLVHGDWVYPIDRNQRIELIPPDPTNPHLCSATIVHDVGAQPAIRQALDNWARSQTPPLKGVKDQVQARGPLYLRTTSTWSGAVKDGDVGVVFAGEKTLQGKPVNGDLDQSELLASLAPSITGATTGPASSP